MKYTRTKKQILAALSGVLAVLVLVCGLAACSSGGDTGGVSSRAESSTLSRPETSSAASTTDSQVEPASQASGPEESSTVSPASQPEESSAVSEVSQPAQSAPEPAGPVQVTGITLSTYEVNLDLQKSKMPIVTMTPANAADKGEIWTSSDPSIATVDGLGRITGVRAGSCTVTVTSTSNPAVSATVAVTVNNRISTGVYSNGKPYYLVVNKSTNTVTAYQADGTGEYCIPVKSMVCSCGNDTPSGTYRTSDQYRWRFLVGDVYGQYATRITGHILFHSVPYLRQSQDSLQYEEYNKLGTTASHGCIRLTVADSLWIYQNCPSGTKVTLTGSPSMGDPLGKPAAQTISPDSPNRGWDPTDPAEGNPWSE